MMRTLPSSRNRNAGVAAVEFAILLPVLVLLAVGVMEYGRAVYQYDTLTKALRSAARLMSEQAAGDTTAEGIAVCLATHGNRDCSGAVLVPGLSGSNVSFSYAPVVQTGSGTISLVTVTITGYQFDALVPAIVPAITFAPIHVSMRQGS